MSHLAVGAGAGEHVALQCTEASEPQLQQACNLGVFGSQCLGWPLGKRAGKQRFVFTPVERASMQ